ncbi:MAG: hypothetical protein E7H38_07755 [Varibaculum cambriense]|uniref:helix-turn-helix domain-containing protein n=1 Tax=Varibaculum cambriense TaxID=184870 RepID=UPI00290A21C7|nr:hypothetical protein [Varibaculum cambriense]MDU4028248.1 hypothetical protein [Varibaculum cambriense]
MTPAQFRVYRQALGLSNRACADELHVNLRSVQLWQKPGGTIPPFAAAWLTKKWEIMLKRVETALDVSDLDIVGTPVKLTLSRTPSQLEASGLKDLTPVEAAAMTGILAASCQLAGRDVQIEYAQE